MAGWCPAECGGGSPTQLSWAAPARTMLGSFLQAPEPGSSGRAVQTAPWLCSFERAPCLGSRPPTTRMGLRMVLGVTGESSWGVVDGRQEGGG